MLYLFARLYAMTKSCTEQVAMYIQTVMSRRPHSTQGQFCVY